MMSDPFLRALLVLAGLCAVTALTAADTADQPTVTVNGEVIQLRQLENELLRKEGADAVSELVTSQLEATDWSTVADDEVLVALPGWKLPRLAVSAALLQRHADRVREELINLTLVRQALSKAGVVIDADMIERELDTMRQRFAATLEAEGKPYVAFDAYIKETQGMPIEQWVDQPGFEILAGVHHLLYQRYPLPEEELRRFLRANYRNYVIDEAVDVSIIYMPFKIGEDPVTEQSRQATIRLAQTFHGNIRSGRSSWKKVWNLLSRGERGNQDHKGWIRRDGSAEARGQGNVPVVVAERAFANRPSGEESVLVDPIITEHGVTLMQVHAYREAQKPHFEKLRGRLQRDYIDSDLDGWTKRFMDELRQQATIDYASLAELMATRKAEAKQLIESMQSGQ